MARRDDAERTNQFCCAIPAHLGNGLCLRRIRQPRKAKQNHAGVHEALAEDQFTEVQVGGHENGAPGIRLLQDLFIDDTGRRLSDIENFVGIQPKAFNHRALDTLIREQVHADRALTG